MSAVYILYVCHDETEYTDLNRGGTIGETKSEIYGIYSKRKERKSISKNAWLTKHIKNNAMLAKEF